MAGELTNISQESEAFSEQFTTLLCSSQVGTAMDRDAILQNCARISKDIRTLNLFLSVKQMRLDSYIMIVLLP